VIIYIDHDEIVGTFNLDDAASYAPAELPPLYFIPQKLKGG
jgi:hypothetical protein